MARKPMVTRTMTTTEVTVLCLNVESAEPCNKTVVLSETYKTEAKLLKAVQEVIDTDSIKAVHIVDSREIETLYGMPEQDFIQNAKILDPATRKEVEQ